MKIARVLLLAGAALAAAASESSSAKSTNVATGTKSQTLATSTSSLKAPASQETIYRHFDCGTDQGNASAHFLDTVKSLHTKEKQVLAGHSGPASAFGVVRISVPLRIRLYLHVVSSTANKGTVTPAMVAAQVDALNAAYNPYGVSFALQAADYTTNDAWAAAAQPQDEAAMKQALRQGAYSDLNLYFLTDLAGGVLGKCTLPTQVAPGTPRAAYAADGCALAAQTMPGGRIYAYNMGKTAVHETGHWLGLLHTFEGYSCSGSGDFVADTPQEAQSTDGCPVSPPKNSCRGLRPGVDPVHNYMDYSTDACYVRFTPGQVARVRALWLLYRAGR